jgi:hypothetical protein
MHSTCCITKEQIRPACLALGCTAEWLEDRHEQLLFSDFSTTLPATTIHGYAPVNRLRVIGIYSMGLTMVRSEEFRQAVIRVAELTGLTIADDDAHDVSRWLAALVSTALELEGAETELPS